MSGSARYHIGRLCPRIESGGLFVRLATCPDKLMARHGRGGGGLRRGNVSPGVRNCRGPSRDVPAPTWVSKAGRVVVSGAKSARRRRGAMGTIQGNRSPCREAFASDAEEFTRWRLRRARPRSLPPCPRSKRLQARTATPSARKVRPRRAPRRDVCRGGARPALPGAEVQRQGRAAASLAPVAPARLPLYRPPAPCPPRALAMKRERRPAASYRYR